MTGLSTNFNPRRIATGTSGPVAVNLKRDETLDVPLLFDTELPDANYNVTSTLYVNNGSFPSVHPKGILNKTTTGCVVQLANFDSSGKAVSGTVTVEVIAVRRISG